MRDSGEHVAKPTHEDVLALTVENLVLDGWQGAARN